MQFFSEFDEIQNEASTSCIFENTKQFQRIDFSEYKRIKNNGNLKINDRNFKISSDFSFFAYFCEIEYTISIYLIERKKLILKFNSLQYINEKGCVRMQFSQNSQYLFLKQSQSINIINVEDICQSYKILTDQSNGGFHHTNKQLFVLEKNDDVDNRTFTFKINIYNLLSGQLIQTLLLKEQFNYYHYENLQDQKFISMKSYFSHIYLVNDSLFITKVGIFQHQQNQYFSASHSLYRNKNGKILAKKPYFSVVDYVFALNVNYQNLDVRLYNVQGKIIKKFNFQFKVRMVDLQIENTFIRDHDLIVHIKNKNFFSDKISLIEIHCFRFDWHVVNSNFIRINKHSVWRNEKNGNVEIFRF